MHYFQYKNGELYCEDVPLKAIAAQFGTPTYVYSGNTILRHFRVFEEAFSDIEHITCFSVKANSNIGILNILVKEGAGMDVVSGGELFRAQRAGCPMDRVVYSGVGKTPEEMRYALKSEILMFNVESLQELETLDQLAQEEGKRARISLRVNPDVDPKTHPYISTGLKKNKFGVDIKEALGIYRAAQKRQGLQIVGISCHIGSQLTEISPFVDALSKVLDLATELNRDGISIKYVDIGGGLGITYDKEIPPHPEDYAKALKELMKDTGFVLILEPGRLIVGNAGCLLTKVLFTKKGIEKEFVVVDGAMNDLIRPSLYGAYHAIWPINEKYPEEMVADVVGPICESGDFFAKERRLPRVNRGDLLCVMSAGAYGFSMSSNYNSRPRAPEILVMGDKTFEIRKRETYEDLIMKESLIPSWVD